MKQRVFQILAGLTVLTLLAAPGWAQERYDRVLENQAQAPEPDEAPAEPKVVRSSLLIALAETIGGAHYLRLTCEGRDSQYWRNRMVELLELEAGERYRLRDAMIEAFNDGYRYQERRYARCGAEMKAEEQTLSRTGADLARQLGDPYL